MKTRLLIIIGIIAASSILFFVLNPTNDHRAYELFPIELKVAKTLEDGSGWYFSGSVYDSDTEIKMSVRSPNGNIITTDTIIPSENGNFAIEITTGGPLWANAGKYILILEQGEFKEIQTFKILENKISVPVGLENKNIEPEPYQETKDHLPAINSKNKWVDPELEPKQESEMTFDYVIESDNGTYGSQYQISGGTVDEITYDSHSNSLIISLNESEQGYLQIVIQTGLLHSFDQLPFTYFVIADGEEVIFEQLSPILLKIPFENDTQKIEIIGTFW